MPPQADVGMCMHGGSCKAPSANGVTFRGSCLASAFEMGWEEFVDPFILFLEDLGQEILSVLEGSFLMESLSWLLLSYLTEGTGSCTLRAQSDLASRL